ncbi:RNA-binding protein 45 [Hydra vulgaris]|uniref:RNA-binding protein 45 n=1 Tax=Hydra vulgaris TaxID=6087 RepID=T2MAK6_HYDVU|nr:RNA-binding protein 45 [Hydra vulgaris]XP_012560301.1 RNA-binding protein 45 [Hydra vulgaris]XP_012560302.1 RNA-binding protein 45 [Hydra vulgaris]
MMAIPTANSSFPVVMQDYYSSYNFQMPQQHIASSQQSMSSSHLNKFEHDKSSDKSNRSNDREKSRNGDQRRERHDSMSRDKGSSNQIDHDKPPFSRVFVVCSKSHTGEDLRKTFEEFGTVEDVWVVKDKQTKENRGVAYIKFSKMSEACLAVEKMDGKKLSEYDDAKPLKVIIAQPKSSKSTEDFNDESALTRLFVVIPKGMDEKDLQDSFDKFGEIEYVQVVKDRKTGEKKGFGYVKFKHAYNAALAVESCDKTFRAVMAEPKSAKLKRDMAHSENLASVNIGGIGNGLDFSLGLSNCSSRSDIPSSFNNVGAMFSDRGSSAIGNRLQVQVAQNVTQEQLARLFDLIPGMELCDLKRNYSTGESKGVAVIVYNSVGSAIYAKEKLNSFEYPPGSKLVVRYAPDEDGQIELSAHQSNLQVNNIPYCTVPLPSAKPISDAESCAERLFIVCQPSPPPDHILKDIFSRFGDLIDVFMLKNKNFGYAKYSSIESAEAAIQTLHGAEILGKKLKVLQAEPPKSNETARKRPRT